MQHTERTNDGQGGVGEFVAISATDLGGLSGGGIHKVVFYDVIFDDVVSLRSLFSAWRRFSKGKRSKKDVTLFELHLEDNLFSLHRRLVSGEWRPDPYQAFLVQDPKLRRIHKASVADRVLYQAVYQALYPLFDKHFIHDSYASRDMKGTHRGVGRFKVFAKKVSGNHRRPAFVLKCDVRKFFDSIDHTILLRLLAQNIPTKKSPDSRLHTLLERIIRSFEASPGKGLPLGNVTSQIFANIYLNELDQFVKYELRARYYIRYCDDFLLLSASREELQDWTQQIGAFLKQKLALSLHPNKVTIRKLHQGCDFLGYVSLSHYRVLRTKTKNRMLKNISALAVAAKASEVSEEQFHNSLASYLGMLGHCRSKKVLAELRFRIS